MPNQTPDTADSKKHWRIKTDSWRIWADPMQLLAEKFNKPLLEAARLKQGQRVLDLASGAGEPALSIGEIISPGGICLATDFVTEMLGAIRQRAGGDRLSYVSADMQALPFRNNQFDRITCRFGIMFPPDTQQVCNELFRLLAPQGRIALMVWGGRQKQTLFNCLSNAIEHYAGIPPDAHHDSIFRFGTPGSLTGPLSRAGFCNIKEQAIEFQAAASLDRPFWRAQLEMSFGHLINEFSPEQKNKLEDEIRHQLSSHRDGKKYRLHSHIRIITANMGKSQTPARLLKNFPASPDPGPDPAPDPER